MDKLKYQMTIQWSNEDNCFLVALPDIGALMAILMKKR
jgi:predicted RNase H-like HicB family nuclease